MKKAPKTPQPVNQPKVMTPDRKERLIGIQQGRAHVAKLKAMRVYSPGTVGSVGGDGPRAQGMKDAIRSSIGAYNTRQRRQPAGRPNGGQFAPKG